MIVGNKKAKEEENCMDQTDPCVKQEVEEATCIKEEEEEGDIIKFIFSPAKIEDDVENLQSLQLYNSQTEEIRDSVGGEECGGPETDPDLDLQPDKTSDSSESDIGDGDERNINDGKKFSCCECGKRFGHKHIWKRHLMTHTGEKPYSCPRCSKTFSQKEHVKTHMIVHTGEKPYSCSFCPRKFTRNYHLKRHWLVCGGPERDPDPHLQPENKTSDSLETNVSDGNEGNVNDGKKFSCCACGKRFGRRGNMNRHMMTHTGEKPYSCAVCSENFTRKENLNSHMRIHTARVAPPTAQANVTAASGKFHTLLTQFPALTDANTARDQLILGLRAGAVQQELQRLVRRELRITFSDACNEARALEGDHLGQEKKRLNHVPLADAGELKWLTLKAANGLNIPYVGNVLLDFEVVGVKIYGDKQLVLHVVDQDTVEVDIQTVQVPKATEPVSWTFKGNNLSPKQQRELEQLVFERLVKHGLKLQPQKCHLFQREVIPRRQIRRSLPLFPPSACFPSLVPAFPTRDV
ncbi:uncharacterized protein KZ484_007500 [Pholidichthys leucotaenia]